MDSPTAYSSLFTTSFLDLKNNLDKDFSGLKKIKIAILGDSATQLLVQALKGYGYETAIDFEIFEADYDQIEKQVFDKTSELYRFKPNFTIVFHSIQRLAKKFYSLDHHAKSMFAESHAEVVKDIYNAVTENETSRLLYFNFPEISDNVFGNYSNKVRSSLPYQTRKLNLLLMNLSQELNNLFINDLSALQNQYGYSLLYDPRIHISADMAFSLEFLPCVAKNTVDIIKSISGDFKKCLIMDLDNTLWGGIIGDDGIENIQLGELCIGKAFTELQLWIKQLKERGIILAVCSKNEEEDAKAPFSKHPDMILRLDDIAVFIANRNNKVDNIRYIQSILNIGYDSMVFIDDDQFERKVVKHNIPALTVPELPDDPSFYLDYLRKINLFETSSHTEEDEKRTRQYQEEDKRSISHKTFLKEEDYLKSLEMHCKVKSFDPFNIPRISQLTQRSNQFNLRTIRYTEAEIKEIANSDNYFTLSLSLKDKFGSYGLISVIILKKHEGSLFIDTWIMSCRVLKRTVELFTLNQIVELAQKSNFKKLIGEYLPTAKNKMVENHYSHLGFTNKNNQWILDLDQYSPKTTFIEREGAEDES